MTSPPTFLPFRLTSMRIALLALLRESSTVGRCAVILCFLPIIVCLDYIVQIGVYNSLLGGFYQSGLRRALPRAAWSGDHRAFFIYCVGPQTKVAIAVTEFRSIAIGPPLLTSVEPPCTGSLLLSDSMTLGPRLSRFCAPRSCGSRNRTSRFLSRL